GVDRVEDHLDAGAVEALHHGLELPDLAAGSSRGVAHVGREERDRVVAPVVGEAAVDQHALGDGVVHRHQLDGGDAERDEVLQDGIPAWPEIPSPQRLRDGRVEQWPALDGATLGPRPAPRRSRRAIVSPAERPPATPWSRTVVYEC